MAILILALVVAVVAVMVLATVGRRPDRHELRVEQWHRACDALSSAAGSGGEHAGPAVADERPDGPTGAGHVRVLGQDPPPGTDRMAAD
ncbi:MAG: hypothetical protein GEV11_25720 [Streptosporangiales bacterium]|nr:hypothetical protein [Streptosporangiales bacterium]